MPMIQSTYTAAVIGSGMIANEGHIPACLAMGKRIELKAICGRNPETLEKTADKFGIPYRFTRVEEMLARIHPDIVAICTPNQSHGKLAAMALEANCHVICEKPLSLDSREIRELYALAKKKNRILVSCQSLRFQPLWFQARRLIREGALGEIVGARFDRIRSRGIPTWGSFHRKADSGGGAMADIGVHQLDGLLWMLGNPRVTSVTGFVSDRIVKTHPGLLCDAHASGAGEAQVSAKGYDPAAFDVEEYATGVARLETGIALSFQAAWAANLPEQASIQILGTENSLTLPEAQLHNGRGFRTLAEDAEAMPMRTSYAEPFSGHKYLLEHVLNVLDGKEALLITPEETINVHCALEMFYRSAEQGREVFLSEL